MSNMVSFLLGVASSVVATILIAVIIQVKTRSLSSWGVFHHFWELSKRLKDSGVNNIFTTRADYVRYRKEVSISDYMATTRRELIYVGFWLAQGREIENIEVIIKLLLERGCTVILILLDPKLDPCYLGGMANYLGISPESLTTRIQRTWDDLSQFQNSLPGQLSNKFTLSCHREIITSSVFIFDVDTIDAKTLVDFKLYGADRGNTFGIELVPVKANNNSLYKRITDSFLRIKNKSLSRVG